MKVGRIERRLVGELGSAERERLARELVAIFSLSFEFADTQMYARRVLFRTPDTQLTLAYDRDGRVVAFNTFNIEHLESGGREYAVLHGSAYGHPQLRGGGEIALRSMLRLASRFKLRHPRARICLVGEAATPAGYARVVRHMPLVHPRPGVEPPPAITELVAEVMRLRGFQPVDGDPWRVELGLPLKIRDPDRMRAHATTSADPSFAYFVERNPGYLDSHWLVVYAPLDLAQLRASLGQRWRAWARPGRSSAPRDSRGSGSSA